MSELQPIILLHASRLRANTQENSNLARLTFGNFLKTDKCLSIIYWLHSGIWWNLYENLEGLQNLHQQPDEKGGEKSRKRNHSSNFLKCLPWHEDDLQSCID